MTRVRHVRIRNFRGIKDFSWFPNAGLNCLIGPGDSGKSTVLDAIDMCLGSRRTVSFSDADFHGLDEAETIEIALTVGDLPDGLKSLEAYGAYLRSFDKAAKRINDEPEPGEEVVLTIVLNVAADLDPVWSLESERAGPNPRFLTWADRDKIAPTRMSGSGHHLGWRRGSILNRLTDEKADASSALADAARHARRSFGDHAAAKLEKTLGLVAEQAKALGVDVGDGLRAMLDAQSVSFGSGTISIHDKDGVPLSAMGTGSTRLLTAGLQRAASNDATIVLVDEVEFGLEPHRIMRLLGSLGAKEEVPPLQGFMTTHSPVVVRELSASQLHLLKRHEGEHYAVQVPADAQSTARTNPEAFLAVAVLVCEGASEVGLLRGLERYLAAKPEKSLFAAGLALVDAGGVSNIYKHALALKKLGYRTAVLRDDDKQPKAEDEEAFLELGGTLFKWEDGMALEDQLFQSLSDAGVVKLLERGIKLLDEHVVADQISSNSGNSLSLAHCRASQDTEVRRVLAASSKSKGKSWFKNVGDYDDVMFDVVIPDLPNGIGSLKGTVAGIVKWARDAN